MSTTFTIILVEDHHELRELLVECLSTAGYAVLGVSCADELNDLLTQYAVDLLILDLNLPGEDGISILKRIRKASPDLYIMILTARSAEPDRVLGYTEGADIYLTKPVAKNELIAAVDGIARRLQWQYLKSTQLRLNVMTMTLNGDCVVLLTLSETKVLKALIEAPANQLEYFELMELASIELNERGKANLEVMMVRLRKKLYAVGAPKPAIKAIHNSAYKLVSAMVLDN